MKNLLLKSPKLKPGQIGYKKSGESDLNARDNFLKAGFVLKYFGSVTTGTEGDVRQIEKAISRILDSGGSQPTNVRFECLEIGIRVTRESDDDVSRLDLRS